MRGLFVTGTHTGGGKSVLSAAIAAALRASGQSVVASKPVLTGVDEPASGAWPPDDALLAAATGQAAPDGAPGAATGPRRGAARPVRCGPRVSPPLAAEQAGAERARGELATRTLATA